MFATSRLRKRRLQIRESLCEALRYESATTTKLTFSREERAEINEEAWELGHVIDEIEMPYTGAIMLAVEAIDPADTQRPSFQAQRSSWQ